jgi:hypothetical protein
MTALFEEVLRLVYALSLYWTGVLTRVVLLAVVGAVILTAWRLRSAVPRSAPRWVTASRGKAPIASREPRRVSA